MPEPAPAVDVVLPTHRPGPWVDEAIASVLAQTHRGWRLTVVDDASPDGSALEVARRWSGTDPRLGFVRLARCGGAAAARNEALRQGPAPWLAFIDQDDRWRPPRLERQLERASAAPDVGVVHADLAHIDPRGRERRGEADPDNRRRGAVDWDRLDAPALTRECFAWIGIRLGAALVRRAAFEAEGGFDARFFGGEEWELWVRLAAAGHRVAHVALPLVERRIHAANTSSVAVARRREGHFAAIAEVVARHPELAPLAPALRARILRSEVLAHLRAGDGRAARETAALLERESGPSAELRALRLLSRAGPLLPALVPLVERAAGRAQRREK